MKEEFYSETFSFFLDAKDGTYFFVQMGVSNIGPGDKKGLCALLIVKPNTKAIYHSQILDEDEWLYRAGRITELFQVNACQLKRNLNQNKIKFTTKYDGMRYELVFDEEIKKQKIPHELFHNINNNYRSEILIAKSNGILKIRKGGSVENIKGMGYMDHTITVALPQDIARKWIRFRSINQTNPIVMLAHLPSDKNLSSKAFMWRNTMHHYNEISSFIDKTQSRNDKIFGNVNWTFHINRFSVMPGNLLYRNAPLENSGWIGRLIAPITGNPVTWIYRAILQIDNGESINGILEVSMVE